jgi:RNA polymerase sigma-70 factor (ECF subfamily)
MAHLSDAPDPDTLARIRAGDREAFERLFRHWYPRLCDWAFRVLDSRDGAEDSVQDVFVAIWRGRERLPKAQSLPAYLHRAVRNRALNQLRHQRTAGRWLAMLDPEPQIAPDAETGLADRELDAAYRAALAELAPRGREVFVLSREQGLTYAQIAETLGISVKTVETLMGRAIAALRGKLGPALGG